MQKSYTKNYLRIYFWQGTSLLLNFLSMFIVLPYLSREPEIFGVYTVCISVSIFLAYADLGFMGAGQKYAAEYFARGQTNLEIQVTGFTSLILLIFLFLLSIVFLYFSRYPWLLIKNLSYTNSSSVASALFLILTFSTPITLFQRILQMIFGVRLEDYIIQRVYITANLIRILSVLWFFRKGQYNIVGYFLFMQLLNYVAVIVALIVAQKRYHYNFRLLLTSLRFNRFVFNKTKKLAFTSFYLTIMFILYHEIDPAVIGKFIGAVQVSIFAVGLSFLSFFRGILSIIYSPFNNRFNHFIGLNDENGLKSFYLHMSVILTPVVVLPILATALLAKPIILSWVGVDYKESVEIAQYLVLCNLFAFISYPSSMLLRSQERIYVMNLIGTIMPFIYWGGIIISYSFLGLKSFAILKFIVFLLSAIIYYRISLDFLKIGLVESMKKIFQPIISPVIFLVVAALFLKDFMPCEKSKLNLLIVTSVTGFLLVISFILQYYSSVGIRNYVAIIRMNKGVDTSQTI